MIDASWPVVGLVIWGCIMALELALLLSESRRMR